MDCSLLFIFILLPFIGEGGEGPCKDEVVDVDEFEEMVDVLLVGGGTGGTEGGTEGGRTEGGRIEGEGFENTTRESW